MSDLAKEIAQTVVRIKSEMRKASFASRSEAGRYAANQRWKGQGKKAKTPLDDLSIPGMTQTKWNADELRTWIDEQEGLLESMQGSASKAELKQQKGLITLARRDLRRMEGSETKVKPKTSKPGKAISSQEANAVERVEMFMRSTENLDQSVLDRMVDKYKTDPVSDADRKLLDETKKEMLAAGEAAKTAIQDAFAGGGRGGTDKLGKTFTSSSRKIKRQMVAEGLERKSPTDPKPEITIRGTILQTKVMVLDRLALQLDDIPEALNRSYGVEKAQFASRSEAGRYAANMRWKGQGQASMAGGASTNAGSDVGDVEAAKKVAAEYAEKRKKIGSRQTGWTFTGDTDGTAYNLYAELGAKEVAKKPDRRSAKAEVKDAENDVGWGARADGRYWGSREAYAARFGKLPEQDFFEEEDTDISN